MLDVFCPRKGNWATHIFGYRITLDLNDFIQRNIYLHTFELREAAMARTYLQPGGIFVDVGANIGYYTLLAASLVGVKGRVFAFEPSPYASARLAETIAENHLNQVNLQAVALGKQETRLPLYLPKVAGNHSPTMLANEGGAPVTVAVRRLDNCLKESGIEKIDLMKIDVEGFESDVLSGAGDYLAQGRIRAILCEFNEFWLQRNGTSSQSLRELLTFHGYRLVNWQSGENLLFVSGREQENFGH